MLGECRNSFHRRRLRIERLEDRRLLSVELAWIEQFGGLPEGTADYAQSTAIDPEGNIYIEGGTHGHFPGETNLGGLDRFVAKFDPSGNRLWTKQLGTSNYDRVHAITADSSGVYLAGWVGTAANWSGIEDAYVAKLDPSGNLLWTEQFGTSSDDRATGIATDSSGAVFVSGLTLGTFPGQTRSSSWADGFVAKIDPSGNLLWAKQLVGQASGIGVDSSGAIYTMAGATSTFPDEPSLGGYDAYVAKLDASGSLLWARRFGTSGNDTVYAFTADSDGQSYAAGQTNGTFSGQTNLGSYDGFAAKFDASGNLLWARQIGTSGYDYAEGISVDGNGGVYVAGGTGAALPGQTHSGGRDAYVAKFNSEGYAQWTKQFGTASYDNAPGVAADDTGGTYVAGYTQGTFPNQTSAGGQDAFVAKFSDNDPPTADAGGPYTVDEGAEITLNGLSTTDPNQDAETLDYHWDFDGDGQFDDATGHTPTFSAASLDGPITLSIGLRVTDDEGLMDFDEAQVTVANVAPTPSISGVTEGVEGSPISLTGSATDPAGANDTLSYVWSVTKGGAPFDSGTGTSIVFTPDDNAEYVVTLTASDEDDGSADVTHTVSIANVPPTVELLTAPSEPVNLNEAPVNVGVTFSDAGSADTHDVTWSWGDSTIETRYHVDSPVTENHTYTEPGVYPVTVTVTDDDGESDSQVYEYIVTYDPEGGFVTGGGWIDSPAGAYVDDPNLTGKATFGFVSKYKKGAEAPTGSTEFNFKAGDLNFHSDSYQWLVVNQNDTNAQYKGTGTINGELAATDEEFKFMLWAGDDEDDTFRIKIWYEDGDEIVVYDNGFDQVIGGGSIVVHTK